MKRQTLRRPARYGDHEHVVVPVAVRRECDPSPIRRETRIDFPRAVVGDALNACAILIGGPDVAEVAEGNPSGVIIRMSREPDRARPGRGNAEHDETNRCTQGERKDSSGHTPTSGTGEYYYGSGWRRTLHLDR